MTQSDRTEKPASLAAMMMCPSDYFDGPMAVTDHPALSKEEKLSILRAMEHDARELSVATEENMAGGESEDLSQVRQALWALDPDAASRFAGRQTK